MMHGFFTTSVRPIELEPARITWLLTDDTLPDDGTTDIVEAPEPANDPVPETTENDPEIEGDTTNEEPA